MIFNREIIFQATVNVIMEKGIHNTSISSIAKSIGMSQGNLYNHFTSKEELINSTYVWIKEKEADYIFSNYPGNYNLQKKFFFLYEKMFKFYVINQCYYNFLQQTFLINQIHVQTIYETKQMFFILDKLYKEGQQQGIFYKGNIHLQQIMVWGMISAIIKNLITNTITKKDIHIEDIITSMWFSLIKK